GEVGGVFFGEHVGGFVGDLDRGEGGDAFGGAEEGGEPGEDVAGVFEGAADFEFVLVGPGGSRFAEPAAEGHAVDEAVVHFGVDGADWAYGFFAEGFPQRLGGFAEEAAGGGGELEVARFCEFDERSRV